MKCFFNILFLLLIFGHNFSQGIYAPTTGVVGTTAIHKDSSIIVSWASNCSVKKGLMQIDDSTLGYVTQGDSADAIGIADGVTVSLGDNGVAIYSLNIPVYNGNGNDFTVFENGFNNTFLELAFVEVSSDGINYFRFPSKSNTQTITQIGSFGSIDCTEIHNLAGKYKVNYGTPFDLEEIPNNLLLNKNRITHIKIIDVIGALDSGFNSFDSDGNIINDPFPTPYASSGFDLDAVGLINISNSVSIKEEKLSINIFPNPAIDNVTIQLKSKIDFVKIYSLDGNLKISSIEKKINLNNLNSGIYILKIKSGNSFYVKKMVKK